MGNCGFTPVPLVEVGDYEFNPNDLMGIGRHGSLYEGNPVANQVFQVAIKEINGNFKIEEKAKAEEFIKKLMKVNHTNVAKFIDYHFDEDLKLYLIIEHCEYGNFHDLLHDMPHAHPIESIQNRIDYCQQLIKGLMAIHEAGITHGHLRAHNILIGHSDLKVSDFGLSELMQYNSEPAKNKVFIYRAPECLTGPDIYDPEVDIWALGILLYEIMYHTRPMEIIAGKHQIYDNLKWGNCSELDDLVKKCMEIEPSRRLKPKDLKNHPFLKIDHEKYKEK